jgi:hypothetical protein
MTTQNKQLFIKALKTLLFSWGGDTPAEAVWASNEFLDFYEKETGQVFSKRFDEDCSNSDEIFDELEKL